MGKVYEVIDGPVREFIQRQQVFFVATAPMSQEGFINLSPKGLDSLRILDDCTVVYADLIGSGIETVAHLKENGRIVLMFCAFEGPPKIFRLHGRGEVIESSHREFEWLRAIFPQQLGLRKNLGHREPNTNGDPQILLTRLNRKPSDGARLFEIAESEF